MNSAARKKFFIVFSAGYLAYSSIYVVRLNFSAAATLLEKSDILNKAQIGLIGSVFSLVYALAKIPNGYIGDYFSVKKVIICGLMIAGFSNLLIGIFPDFVSIVIFWGLNAYGQSMLWGPLLRVFSENYEEKRLKKISQILVSSVAVGSIVGLMLASLCVSFESVAACFLIPGAITLIMAVVIKLFFIDAPGQKKSKTDSMIQATKNVFREARFRWIIFPTVSHGIIKDNINVWLAVYFVDTYGINLKAIAGYIFVVPVFGFIGRLLYLPLYRMIKNEYAISILAFGFCSLATAVLCMKDIPAFLSMVCLGLISALVSMINTHLLSAFPADFPGHNNISFVASIMDVLTYGGAGIGSLCFGILIQSFGYKSMFLVWIGISVISIWFLGHFYKMKRKWLQ